jgi:Tfp pilus assembly protein PilN
MAVLGGVFVLFFLLAGLFWWRNGAAKAQLQTRLETAVRDSASLARTISLMQQLEARRDTIERKIEVIRSVDGRRYIWPHLLDEISRAVPQYTWLVKVTATEEEPEPVAPSPGSAAAKAAEDSAAATPTAPPVPVEPEGPAFTIEGNTGSTQALTRLMKNLEASPLVREVALVTSEQATQEGRTFLKFTLEGRYERPDSAFIETVPVLTPE